MFRRFRPTRESYIPEGSTKVTDKQSDAVAYLWTSTRSGKVGATIFVGKQNKPLANYVYRDEARRAQAIAEAFESRRKTLAFKTDLRAKRKAWVPTYKVGDVFRTCWGYDQTNVEYFELVEIHGKHGIFRELEQERTETGWMQGSCVPLPGQYAKPRFEGDDQGKPIRRLLQEHGIKIDDVRTAWLRSGENVAGVRVIAPASWSSYH